MERADTLIKLFGTSEPEPVLRHVSTGPLSFFYSQDGLRRISWHGIELVRAVAWPIRDENWGTYPAEIIEETIEDSDGFKANLSFSVGGGRLVCALTLSASDKGDVQADLTLTPAGGPFSTNRAGFTILHPIDEFAGAPLSVTHSDGSSETTSFPAYIQPDQPVKDITGLRYGLEDKAVDIRFDGEVFEMEDQRNWSDASYKTYCVPLVHPFTYDIAEPITQSIRISLSGGAVSRTSRTKADLVSVQATTSAAPDIGLAVTPDWLPGTDQPKIDASHLVVRLSPLSENLAEIATFARSYPMLDLEIVLPDDADVAESLAEMARSLAAAGVFPRRVIALRAAYLGSHQPVGPWPEGMAPNDMLADLRAAFPMADIGAGMLTNFTELNRYRPDTDRCDYITHGLTPLVHAGDDMSVWETLETLPQIFASGQKLAHGRPYRLGLASIGMRSNPYGAAVADNPTQIRRTMARIDPRHRGLFGAAFAVGVLATTENTAVEALCLGAPVGPFGLVYTSQDHPQEGYDGAGRTVYPLYHVVREAAAVAGQPRLLLDPLPKGVFGFGAEVAGQGRVMLANTTGEMAKITLDRKARMRRLDCESFDAATRSPDWLDHAERSHGDIVDLPPMSIAFLELELLNS